MAITAYTPTLLYGSHWQRAHPEFGFCLGLIITRVLQGGH